MSVLEKKEQIQEHINFCLQKAKNLGVDACEVGAHYSIATDIEVRMSQVERLEFSQDRGLSLTLYANYAKASVSTTDFNEAALSQLIEKAHSIAKFTASDDCNGLAEKNLLAYDYPDLDLYHPWDIHPDEIIEKLTVSESVGLSSDKRITNSDGASFSTSNTLYAYANSHGFKGDYLTSSHYYGCGLLAETGAEKQRESEYTLSRVPNQLEDFSKVAKHAAKKALDRLGAKTLPTQQAPVIFNAQMAKGLFATLLSAISGRSLYSEASFLLNARHQKIFADTIEIVEDPLILQGLASSPFDGDGVRTQKRSLVEAGILQGYLLSHYSAKRLGMQTTGNAGGAHNILVKDHGLSFNALIKQMHKGLLVTELMGHGVNLVTGDYSRGASGYWIENGEIAYPVQEITIAGNLKEMFLGMRTISNDIDKRGKIQTGSVLIDNMTIAGH